MKRSTIVIILIVISIFITTETVYADYKDPVQHPGALTCWPCHIRFSYKRPYSENLTSPIRNNNVLQFNSCSKDDCHNGVKMRGGIRVRNIHAKSSNDRVCKNCHAAKNGTYQIHTIHLKPESVLENIPEGLVIYKSYNWTLPPDVVSDIKRPPVDCALCHWAHEGYNSPLVSVPPYEELYIANSSIKNSSIRRPPWNNDCGYCHPSVRGAERLHDVHEPVAFKACIVCHSPIMLGRDDLAMEQFGRPFPDWGKKEVPSTKTEKVLRQVTGSLPTRELSSFFEKIAEYMLAIFNALRG